MKLGQQSKEYSVQTVITFADCLTNHGLDEELGDYNVHEQLQISIKAYQISI